MKTNKRKKQVKRQQKLQERLAHKGFASKGQPLLRNLPISYEVADRTRVLGVGGLGAIHRLVTKLALPALINQRVCPLKRHLPYFESDHILSLCYSLLCGGKPLEDINRLRTDLPVRCTLACAQRASRQTGEVYLNALGVERLPAPSTAGDFLRRFKQDDILNLQEAINQARVKVWKTQDETFFKQAIIPACASPHACLRVARKQADRDMDGTIFSTDLPVRSTQTGMLIASLAWNLKAMVWAPHQRPYVETTTGQNGVQTVPDSLHLHPLPDYLKRPTTHLSHR